MKAKMNVPAKLLSCLMLIARVAVRLPYAASYEVNNGERTVGHICCLERRAALKRAIMPAK